jgi:two-component system, NtrC family, sensor histidine kinase KinB
MEHPQGPKHELPTTARMARSSEPLLAKGTGEDLPMPRDARGLREDEAAQLVHDLRAPLTTIMLDACILDRKLASSDASDSKRSVARILRNVEFLDRIVQDLLDSCAASSGHLELRRRPTELRALVERVIDRIVPTHASGCVSLDAPVPITIAIDDLRIERVIANLVGNALKYAPPGSRIVVRLEAAARSARISVTDNGPGLAPADLAHVFDRYRRGSRTHGIGGWGLGLYASKAIVEAHGGTIDVESVPGEGSQFYFELPATSI